MTTLPKEAIEAGEVRVQLCEAPIGLFYSEAGVLCVKTEYGNDEGRVDAYIVESGEFFWGGAKSPMDQSRVLVTPAILAAAPEPPAVAIKPVAHLIWLQGQRAVDDFEDYYEVARPGDKSVDGSDPFPVYREPAAPVVKVKPLVWDGDGRADLYKVGPSDWRGKPQAYWAISAHGKYGIAGFVPTIEDAKSAAQADYEARIRSALVDAPASAPASPNSSAPADLMEQLGEALEPFAKVTPGAFYETEDDAEADYSPIMTPDDFRAARAALEAFKAWKAGTNV